MFEMKMKRAGTGTSDDVDYVSSSRRNAKNFGLTELQKKLNEEPLFL